MVFFSIEVIIWTIPTTDFVMFTDIMWGLYDLNNHQRSLQCREKTDCMLAQLHFVFVKHLPYMPILGSSKSAANKHMMSNILTNGDTGF